MQVKAIVIAQTALALCLAAPALAQVNVNLPWIRSTAPSQNTAAVFMKLEAHAAQGVALVGASSPLAESVELRGPGRTARGTGIARVEMRAGSSVLLKPGSTHLLLRGLKQPLRKGARVPLTLEFETGDARRIAVNVEAEVVGASAKSALDHHH